MLYYTIERGKKERIFMKVKRRNVMEPRNRSQLGPKLPFVNLTNPFKVETKMASAGLDKMKMGAGIFMKVKF